VLIDAPARRTDAHGSGAYGASRAGGRRHRGVDIACYPGSRVLAVAGGRVSKIGYPYDPTDARRGHLRYVELTDADGFRARYFYVAPSVEVGSDARRGAPLGITQPLRPIYPGITEHLHFEVIAPDGHHLNPADYAEIMP